MTIENAEIKAILRNPFANDRLWHPHGIGMLRSYLDEERTIRLNVWHKSLLNPGISTMHTHPWRFSSRVVIGHLTNTRYERSNLADLQARTWMEDKITCGPGFNGLGGRPEVVYLRALPPEHYFARDAYVQEPPEIHVTEATDGTCTIMERGPSRSDHEASVFWPLGEEWGDATRHCTRDEMQIVFDAALRIL